MQRDVYLATFFWILVVLWMAFIFHLSAQPASQSKDLSLGLTDYVLDLLNRFFPTITIDTSWLHAFFRKLAHFVVFFLLAVLMMHAMRASGFAGKRAMLTSLLVCILYAISDEWHQFFVPHRGAQLSDVILDTFGSGMGIFLTRLWWGFGSRLKRKRV